MPNIFSSRWVALAVSTAMLLMLVAACGGTKTIEVPGETKTIEVPGETVVVTKEVIKEVLVPGETVVVTKEVIKEVPGETVVVENEVVKVVAGPERIVTKEVPAGYIIDPTNGKVYTAPAYGGTLYYALDRVPPNADQSVGGNGAGYAVSGVVEKLGLANWGIDRSVNALNNEYLAESHLTGNLAERWSNPDPLTYIFHIRQDVNWHNKAPMNGRALTAEDVVFNFHRYTGTGSGFTEPSAASSQLLQLKYESIEAVGNSMVIKLTEPRFDALPLFLDDASAYINAPEVIKEHGNVVDWRNLVGTGPFQLVDWIEGDSLTWERNVDYWKNDEKYPENQLPYIDRLKALLIMDSATYTAALRAGKIDYMGHNASTMLKTVDEALSLMKTNPEINSYPYTFRANNAYVFNTTQAPFDQVNVRKAMQMALDLDTINNTYWSGFADTTPQTVIGTVQKGYGVPFEDWSEDVKAGYTYNPAGAEALLDTAGYPRGSDGIRFTTTVDLNAADAQALEYAVITNGYFAEIGVDVKIESWDGAVHRDRARGQLYGGMTPFISSVPYPPLVPLAWQYTGDLQNRGGWSDATYDALVDEARKATSVAELQSATTQAAMMVAENHWYIASPIAPWYNFSQPWVQGFDGDFFFGGWQKNSLFARLWIDQNLKESMSGR